MHDNDRLYPFLLLGLLFPEQNLASIELTNESIRVWTVDISHVRVVGQLLV